METQVRMNRKQLRSRRIREVSPGQIGLHVWNRSFRANGAAFGSSETCVSHSAEISISLSGVAGSERTSNSLDSGTVEDAGV